ncbi:MAG TPA: glycosyltransferase family 9 protein [Vicinamibacteria bacterium]
MSLFFAPSRKLAAHRLAHGGPRIYDPRERLLLASADALLRGVSRVAGLRPRRNLPDVRRAERVLALRLDRLGDLLTTLPALELLRRALPEARLELAVGSWNEPVARRLPFVDAVRIVDAPWSAWGAKASFGSARAALGRDVFDLAIDFQGDVRVLLLMALSGAKLRAGYGDTGGDYLLTHRARWNERRTWYEQNVDLVQALFPEVVPAGPIRPYNFLSDEDRNAAAPHLENLKRPIVGLHPSAGRALKEWEPAKFAELADRLSDAASVVLTGSELDRPLVERIVEKARARPANLLGLPLPTFAAVIESLDVFVTGDTGPMHLSHAVGTRNVAIFGPSDPVRYGPDESLQLRRVVRSSVYCSPCNMIRRPPVECVRAITPECLSSVTMEQVLRAIQEALRAT